MKNKMHADELTEIFPSDYSIAFDKLDKFMDDDPDAIAEYYELMDDQTLEAEVKIKRLAEQIEMHCVSEERMFSYFPADGTVEGFARYLVGLENA